MANVHGYKYSIDGMGYIQLHIKESTFAELGGCDDYIDIMFLCQLEHSPIISKDYY